MIFEPTPIHGAWKVRLARLEDDRGFFARTWCAEEFAAHGIAAPLCQASISYNRRAGTLRGMHYARPPAHEGKLVRCERGRVHDVIIDLRPGSPSYLRHMAVELDANAFTALYVPPLVAHGFQTLEPDCTVLYMMTETYRPADAAGICHDDAACKIDWPQAVTLIAERDRTYPDFDPRAHEARCASTSPK